GKGSRRRACEDDITPGCFARRCRSACGSVSSEVCHLSSLATEPTMVQSASYLSETHGNPRTELYDVSCFSLRKKKSRPRHGATPATLRVRRRDRRLRHGRARTGRGPRADAHRTRAALHAASAREPA